MTNRKGLSLSLLLFLIGMIQIACGGGGGGDSTTNIPPAGPTRPVITAPSPVTTGSTGHTASVPAQTGVTFTWTISGGTITAPSPATGTNVTFSAGAAGTLRLTCEARNAAGAATGTRDVTVNSSASLTPIARWDTVPYQRINTGQTLNCGVVAFSKAGIDRVEFYINGQGYKGPSPVITREMTLNSGTGVYEYWIPLSADAFASDGSISVEAVVHGTDGGVRDKDTGGGGLGLDSLPLVVNPLGTLPQPEAWVDVTGVDAQGAVGDSTHPYGTVGGALEGIRAWMVSHGHGSKVDGGIVRLNQGNHTMSNGGHTSVFPTVNEWVTITTAAGGNRVNTRISTGSTPPRANHLKVAGMTLRSTKAYGLVISTRDAELLWVDDVESIGAGRALPESNPVSGGTANKWVTNSYIHDADYGVGRGMLARGLVVEHIANDLFANHPLGINVAVDDIDIDPNAVTYWHADMIQYYGTSAPRNTIMYGVRGTNLHYQGLMLRWGDGTQLPPGPPPADMAFVNVLAEMREPFRPGSVGGGESGGNMWMMPVDHLLFWHVSIINPREDMAFAFYNDGQQHTIVTNLDVRGSLFSRVTSQAESLDLTSWADNHFRWATNCASCGGPSQFFTIAPGINKTSGDPLIDASGSPLAGSPLLDRVSPLLVPVDAKGTPRSVPADVGAFEVP